MSTPEAWFRAHGLEPLAWADVLRRVEAGLQPAETETFARLHRAFAAYPAEHTCRAFYDFIARHELHDALACHRFERLRGIAEAVEAVFPDNSLRGARVLDYGAGGGHLAEWLRDAHGAHVTVADLSAGSVERLVRAGFARFEGKGADKPEAAFDLILCADSLGEIHADEDDWLSDDDNAEDDDFSGELEARYGFAYKLAALKPLLAPRQKCSGVLLFEPVTLEHFWRGAANSLETAGWQTTLRGPDPVWCLHLQHPA